MRFKTILVFYLLVIVYSSVACTKNLQSAEETAPLSPTATIPVPRSTGVLQDSQISDAPSGHTVELRATAPRIFPHSWSPDGAFLAYWTFTADEVAEDYKYPPGTLNFLNARTGATCTYPHEVYYYNSQFSWVAPAQFLTVSFDKDYETSVLRNTPCMDQPEEVTDLAGAAILSISTDQSKPSQLWLSGRESCWLYDMQTQSVRKLNILQAAGCAGIWSPTATYVAYTNTKYVEGNSLMATTSIFNVNSGEVVATAEWEVRQAKGELAPLVWLGAETLLIPETLEQGPLLLTVGQGSTQVAPTWFHVEASPGQRAFAVAEESGGEFHAVLKQEQVEMAPESKNVLALLYDSATNQVVELPFKTMLDFSPDGRWAYGFNDNESGGYLWRLDGNVENMLQLPLVHDSFNNEWNPNSTQIATGGYGEVLIFGLPSGEQIDQIEVGSYAAWPFGWSPDGRYFAIGGRGSGQEALFVAQMYPN